MKKLHLIYLLPAVFFMASCEEQGPNIELEPPEDVVTSIRLLDTSYISDKDTSEQDKNIIIEDYTGVRCNNCPVAAEKADAIKANNPGRVYSLAIHVSKFFGEPYKESKEDYRITGGQDLYDYLGGSGSGGLPTGNVDRVRFSGENKINTSYNNWAAFANQRLELTSPVNFSIKILYDEVNDQYVVRTKSHFTSSETGDFFITVTVAENKIIDYQAMPDSKNPEYEHNHVLREFLSNFNGQFLLNNPSKNQVIIKDFVLTFDSSKSHWKKENLEVIALIHRKGSSEEVLQVQKADLTE